MGYWENTAYIRCDDVARIAEAMTRVFAEEGYHRCMKPPRRKPQPFDVMQYGKAAQNALWRSLSLPPGAVERAQDRTFRTPDRASGAGQAVPPRPALSSPRPTRFNITSTILPSSC